MLVQRFVHREAWSRWLRPSFLALVVLTSLAWGQAAYAAEDSNTITVYAPAAPATAYTVVEWQDPSGVWHAVEGWQGSLDTLEDTGLRLKQWTVYPENADQGPFRWVIYTSQDGAVWGESATFNLPGGEGVNLAMTVEAQTSTTTTATTAAASDVAVTATPASAVDVTTGIPRVATDESTWLIDCAADCDYALITVFLPEAPEGSWVGVQYQAPDGTWQDVQGWQGTAQTDENGRQFMQWTVFSDNYHQGSFRWVITEPSGAAWGVGAEFRLPGQGANYIQFLLRH